MNKKHTLLSIKYLFIFSCVQLLNAQQIYTNGSLSTGVTSASGVVAPAGYTWSELQNDTTITTEVNRNTGFAAYFNNAGTTSFQLADNFIVPAGEQWNISSFDFFIHQNSYFGINIPVDQLRIQIWNGDPSLSSSVVIFGNMSTNVLNAASEGNTFIYRIPNSIIGNPVIAPNTNRKIWKIRGTSSVVLNAGSYWVVYQFHAINDGAIFIPSVTLLGTRGLLGWNAKQNFVANTVPSTVLGWASVVDVGDPTAAPDIAQDLPFLINGMISTLDIADNKFSSLVFLYPNPVKNILNQYCPK